MSDEFDAGLDESVREAGMLIRTAVVAGSQLAQVIADRSARLAEAERQGLTEKTKEMREAFNFDRQLARVQYLSLARDEQRFFGATDEIAQRALATATAWADHDPQAAAAAVELRRMAAVREGIKQDTEREAQPTRERDQVLPDVAHDMAVHTMENRLAVAAEWARRDEPALHRAWAAEGPEGTVAAQALLEAFARADPERARALFEEERASFQQLDADRHESAQGGGDTDHEARLEEVARLEASEAGRDSAAHRARFDDIVAAAYNRADASDLDRAGITPEARTARLDSSPSFGSSTANIAQGRRRQGRGQGSVRPHRTEGKRRDSGLDR